MLIFFEFRWVGSDSLPRTKNIDVESRKEVWSWLWWHRKNSVVYDQQPMYSDYKYTRLQCSFVLCVRVNTF